MNCREEGCVEEDVLWGVVLWLKKFSFDCAGLSYVSLITAIQLDCHSLSHSQPIVVIKTTKLLRTDLLWMTPTIVININLKHKTQIIVCIDNNGYRLILHSYAMAEKKLIAWYDVLASWYLNELCLIFFVRATQSHRLSTDSQEFPYCLYSCATVFTKGNMVVMMEHACAKNNLCTPLIFKTFKI